MWAIRGIASVGSLLVAELASAQVTDHLACRRITGDAAVRPAMVNVASEALGNLVGCTLERAKLLCSPSTLETPQPGGEPGPSLRDDRVCYRIHCRGGPKEYEIEDGFGQHALRKLRPRYLCLPAAAGDTDAAVTDTGAVVCHRAKETAGSRLTGVLRDAFGAEERCRTKRKSRLACVPATTTVVDHSLPTLRDIDGSVTDVDRVCYAARCRGDRARDVTTSDLLGRHDLRRRATRWICSPAGLSAIPSTSTTAPTGSTTTSTSRPPGSTTTSTTATTTTSTSTTTTTSVSTTLPPGTSAAGACQRAIEVATTQFVDTALAEALRCAETTGEFYYTCAGVARQNALVEIVDAARPAIVEACEGLDVWGTLGYADQCGTPSGCRFPTSELDAYGVQNDVIDCIACRLNAAVERVLGFLFVGGNPPHACRVAIAHGGLRLMLAATRDLVRCLTSPGAISIAACIPDGLGAADWRNAAVAACEGYDPYTTLPRFIHACSGRFPVVPGVCASTARPCTFTESVGVDDPAPDNDLLDCLECRLEEELLEIGRAAVGANLCCIDGVCDTVRTRFACEEAGGVPVHYRLNTIPDLPTGGAHGIDVADDGTLYVAGAARLRVAPDGTRTLLPSIANGTGIAADAAGNVYVTQRCGHRIWKIDPEGTVSPFAGTGASGSSGDGGPATEAQIVAPDGVTVDTAGNVYFTESSLLGILCRAPFIGSEKVRMVDTDGIMHTLIGADATIDVPLLIPYGLHMAPGDVLHVGEAGFQRVFRLSIGAGIEHVAGRRLGIISGHSGDGGPAKRGRFYQNCGVDGDPDGNVVIAPMEDNRIVLVDSLGSMITIAGTGDATAPVDGALALQTTMPCPEDVAVGPDATIYVADIIYSRIRTLTQVPFP